MDRSTHTNTPCTGCDPRAAAPLPAVEVEPVVEKVVPINGKWVGTTAGYVTATIRARVSWYLMRQTYSEAALVSVRV